MILPPALLTPANASPGIDVDAILATGGVVLFGSFDLTIGTTLLSSMADGLTVANSYPTNWTAIFIAGTIGNDPRITNDPDGENVVLVAASGFAPDMIVQSATAPNLYLPGAPLVAGVSQVAGGATVARVNGGPLAGMDPVGQAVLSLPYVAASSGDSEAAIIIIPSALTADELDAIYAATVFP